MSKKGNLAKLAGGILGASTALAGLIGFSYTCYQISRIFEENSRKNMESTVNLEDHQLGKSEYLFGNNKIYLASPSSLNKGLEQASLELYDTLQKTDSIEKRLYDPKSE